MAAILMVPCPAYGRVQITGENIFFFSAARIDDAKAVDGYGRLVDRLPRLVSLISRDYRNAPDEFARRRLLEMTRPLVERRLQDARDTSQVYILVETSIDRYDFDRRAFPLARSCHEGNIFFSFHFPRGGSKTGECYDWRLWNLHVQISLVNADDLTYIPVPLQKAESLAPYLRESRAVTLRVVGTIKRAFRSRRWEIIEVEVQALDVTLKSGIKVASMKFDRSPIQATQRPERLRTPEMEDQTNDAGSQQGQKTTRPTTDWKTACAPIPQSTEFGEEHVRFEHCLRTFRFHRLAENQGVQAPSIEPLMLPADESPQDYPVPALRLAWENDTFFDTGDDQLLERIVPVIDLVALALKRDIGDASLYVVGHTDSRGGAAYNEDLSLRRARSVVDHLADAGVPHHQISYTGMGERQPIAPNRTENGRSRNRRVEFLISAFRETNLALVRTRAVNEAWLDHHEAFVAIAKPVEVFSLEEGAQPEVFDLPPPISREAYAVEAGG